MKVLIVSPNINDQIQFLAHELEKIGLDIELIDTVHPVRLILNKYDLIHFIHDELNLALNLKTIFAAWSAKSFGIATLLTTYSRLKPNALQKIELGLFDAISLPCISELKKIRFFNGQKIILPYFPQPDGKFKIHSTSSEKKQFVFPVLDRFEDLLKINFNTLSFIKEDHDFYVDAHELRSQQNSSQIRKNWQKFILKNKQFKNFNLFTEKTTLLDVIKQHPSYTFINHLDLNSLQVGFWMDTAMKYNNLMILNEDQGTGFSDLWKTEKNCFVFSHRISTATQYQFLNHFINESPHSKSTARLPFDFRKSLDLKLNELARLYTKILTQKTSLMHHNSVNMNL